MEGNQFFYSREVKRGEETLKFVDSFNLDYVIRSVQTDENTLVILLDDAHTRHS